MRRVWLTILFAVAAVVFAALGIWQVERRAWKLALIDRVGERVHAAPAAAPGRAAWADVTAERDEYRHVAAAGRFRTGDDTYVQAVTDLGPGFWVMTPLDLDGGGTLLVNRGFVPATGRTFMRPPPPSGEVRVTGLLRMSEPGGGFLRSNDAAADRWYSRDVAAIAARRQLGAVAPYFIDADAVGSADAWPRGGLTVIHFRNAHLVYALTWFALAFLAVFGMVILWRRAGGGLTASASRDDLHGSAAGFAARTLQNHG
jgi:surfeit locus 1 family protein